VFFYVLDYSFTLLAVQLGTAEQRVVLPFSLPPHFTSATVVHVSLQFSSNDSGDTVYGFVRDTFRNSTVFAVRNVSSLSRDASVVVVSEMFGLPPFRDSELLSPQFVLQPEPLVFHALWANATPAFFASSLALHGAPSLTVHAITDAFFDCAALQWDAINSRLTTLLVNPQTQQVTFAAVNTSCDLWQASLLQRYDSVTAQRLSGLAYQPASGELFLKLQGNFDTNVRTYVYLTVDTANNGSLESQLYATKIKGHDNVWHYQGPKIGRFLAFASEAE